MLYFIVDLNVYGIIKYVCFDESEGLNMDSFYNTVLDVLKQDERFFSDDRVLLRNAVYDAAMQMDSTLIKILYENEVTRDKFFSFVDDIAVFDKVGFGWVINNRQFLPDSYTRYKNKIGLIDSKGDYIANSNDIELVFPYKDCVLEGGQTKEDQKRSEIFYNEILAPDEVDRLLYPKVFSNAKRYSADGIETDIEFFPNDNLIIRSNNVLALSSICRKYRNSIQFIYIDPPYNTANDSFRYNDSFKRSTWLAFMKNRLVLAKELLHNSGVIAIQINYKEYAYLKILCDEIFEEDNYINTVTVKTATTASFRAINDCPVNVSEFILLYAKNKKSTKIKPVYIESDYSEDYGSYIKNKSDNYLEWEIVSVDSVIYEQNGVKSWQEFRALYGEDWKNIRYKMKAEFCLKNSDSVVSLNTMQKPSKAINEAIILSKKNRGKVYKTGDNYFYNGRSLAFYSKKLRLIDNKMVPTEILTNIWNDISFLSLGTEGGVDLPNGKKPERLIKRLFEIFVDKNDIIMDYHLGTGTTCAVAHKLGIQYIGVEQLDYGNDDTVQRLKNVICGESGGISNIVSWKGGGSFVYCELAKLNQKFVDEIQNADSDEQIISIYQEVLKTGFISCKVNPKDIDTESEDFKSLSIEDKKRLLMELLDKNQLYVNYCDIDDEDFDISEADKAFTKSFYGER